MGSIVEQRPPPQNLSVLAIALALKIGCIAWLAFALYWDAPSFDMVSIPHSDSKVWDIGPLGSILVPFEDSSHYQAKGPSADAEWSALVPDDGLLYLGHDSQPYTMSMFHQLQCLDIIRKSILNTVGGDAAVGISSKDGLVNHCINYMRQMALCRADDALEDGVAEPIPNVFVNRMYTCRDWRKAYDAFDSNRNKRNNHKGPGVN